MAKQQGLLEALFANVAKEAAQRRKKDTWFQKGQLLRGMLMPIQVALEEDPSRFIAVRAARRTGKSTGVMFIVAIRCLERAQSEWVVIGLTRPSVKRIYWGPLQKLNEAFELGIKFHHQELSATFRNGSKIYFCGAENASEIEKLRGGKYDGVIVDECKSFNAFVFQELIQDVLGPALLDKAGQMYIIGTPGDELAGPFYLATCEEPVNIGDPEEPRYSNKLYGTESEHPYLWSLHAWSLRDNTTRFENPRSGQVFTLWDAALEEKKKNGWRDDHPTWRREYLGHWVPSDFKKVYRYRPHLHDYTPCQDTRWGLPGNIADEPGWQTCMGWDFGSRDGTAIVIWAFHPTIKGLWEVYSERKVSTPEEPLNVSALARWYHELDAEFGPFAGYPADPAGLATMVMETLATEHGVHLEPAEKKEKNDHIELFNNDLDAGLIHVRRGGELSRELLEDRWDAKTIGTDRRKEDPAVPNDVADAGLYGFRWCRHRSAHREFRGPAMFTREWYAEECRKEMALAIKAAQSKNAAPTLDANWWE